jgi:RNA polymerase sigma factor (sigma-70 family)
LTDKEIIDGILAGRNDENIAIEMLYEQNKTVIKGFLNKMSSYESVKEADDVIWEGIEALVNNIKRGKYVKQAGIGLNAYLKSILRNLWLKQLSSESARTNRQHSYFETSEPELDISELIAEKEIWDSYLAIFEKVGKNCKRLLQMVYGLGYSIKEMAQELIAAGLYDNEQVVRNAKSKCLKRVALQLGAR